MNEYFLTGVNGVQIFFREWVSRSKCKAAIVIIHGMGEHSGRYNDFANYFVNQGFNVLATDLFGHGKTEGKKGYVSNIEDFYGQIELAISQAQKWESPIFLYGHSMGGCLVLKTLVEKNLKINGVVASAPALKPGFKVPFLKFWGGKVLRQVLPTLTLKNGLELKGLSKDPQVIEAYKNDKLTHDFISGEIGIGIIEWGEELMSKNINSVSSPLLLMHGDKDILTSFEATKQFYAKFTNSDVSFKPWYGLYHELHNEPEKAQVLDFVLKWFNSHL